MRRVEGKRKQKDRKGDGLYTKKRGEERKRIQSVTYIEIK